MRMKKKILLASIVLLLATGPAWGGKLFKWKDENGKTHYTDSKAKISRKYRNATSQMRSATGVTVSSFNSISNEEILTGLKEGKRPEDILPKGPPKPSEECYAMRGMTERERKEKEKKHESCMAKLDAFEKFNQDFLNRWDKFQEWNMKRRMQEEAARSATP